MSKKIFAAIITLFISATLFAQETPVNDTTAPCFRDRNMPMFRMYNLDSLPMTQSVLVKFKKTIIMMFNPECDHCQKQLTTLLGIPEVVQNTQIIMVSTQPLAMIKDFYLKNHLEQYPNIHMGKDIKYFWLKQFKPVTIPVLAFYNEQDQFIVLHQGNMTKAEVLAVLKK